MKNGRCSKHGGKSLAGIASPSWKHGKFSKHLPQGMGQLAWDASTDQSLMDLTELIGVYQARLQHLLGLVGTGASPERFKEIRATVHELHTATTRAQVELHMAKLLDLVDSLEHDWLLWKDIDVAAGNFKKLIESERKRRIEIHALVPTQKATAFAREVVLAVRAEITDPAALQRIHSRVEEIIGGYPQLLEGSE